MTDESQDNEQENNESLSNFSITPAITSLLKPTTEYLGIEIRDYVKEKIQNLKTKKDKKI